MRNDLLNIIPTTTGAPRSLTEFNRLIRRTRRLNRLDRPADKATVMAIWANLSPLFHRGYLPARVVFGRIAMR
jgi:hypothetical protein